MQNQINSSKGSSRKKNADAMPAGKNAGKREIRVRRSFSAILGESRTKRILFCVLCFFTALLVAGTAAFPGTYPFGVAAIAAAGGVLPAAGAALGALCGSVRIPTVGVVYAVTFAALFLVRLALSFWLTDPGGDEEKNRAEGKTGRMRERLVTALRRGRDRILKILLEESEETSDFGAPLHHPARSARSGTGETPGAVDAVSAPKAGKKMNVGTVLREPVRIRMALSACAALFAGAWSVVAGGYDYADLFGAVFSVFTTPLLTWLFYAAADRNMRASPMREFGVYALLMAVTMSLHAVSARVFGLSLPLGSLAGEGAILRRRTLFDAGTFFALSAALVIAQNDGWHRGALAGALCGMTMEPAYVPQYVLAVVVYAVLERLPAVFPVLGAGIAAVSWCIFAKGIDGFTYAVPPAAVMCAALVPLFRYDLAKTPPALFGPFPAAEGRGWARSRRGEPAGLYADRLAAGELIGRTKRLSEGLASVSAVLYALSDRMTRPSGAELRALVGECCARQCESCTRKEDCRGDGRITRARETFVRSAAEALRQSGSVSAALVPPALASRCPGMGDLLDEIGRAAGDRMRSLSSDRLNGAASDWALAGELFRRTEEGGRDASARDGALEKKLKRLLSLNDFAAGSVQVYGGRRKHICVSGVDLLATRLGGDDIRRLFEGIVKLPLSGPEFEVDGSALSMRMQSVSAYFCRTGSFSCAASGVHRYWGDQRSRGAYSGERRSEGGDAADGRDRDSGGEGIPVDREKVEVSDSEPEEVCGDIITDFEADGRYYMILSDGMGSGKEAALSSGLAVSLLEKLIRSGAGMETSLKLLNQIIRSTGRECSATVDVAEIDLATGEARFVKSGAAPSFVLRDGSIFRLQSKTVPIGILRALDAEMIRFDVRQGDTVVMVSDGAARSYDEEPWLLDLLSSDDCVLSGDERAAAMTVVSEAAVRGAKDDITCGIIRIFRKAG